MYFMSTACGRPQGGEGVRLMWTGEGGQKHDFCRCHKWMAPNSNILNGQIHHEEKNILRFYRTVVGLMMWNQIMIA